MALNFLNNGYFAGKVGIGEVNPTTTLHVDSISAFPTLTLARSTTHSGISFTAGISNFTGAGADLLFDGVGNSTGFGFRTKNSSGTQINALVIAPSGNVGITETNPLHKLSIKSTDNTRGILINNTSTGSYAELHLKANREYRIGTGGSATAADAKDNFYIYDATAATHRLTLTSTGDFGIGTFAPTEKLEVDGNIKTSGDIILTTPASANDSSGIVFGVANSSVTFGQVYFLNTAGNSWGVALSSSSNCTRLIALGAGTSSSKMLFNGMFKAASHGFTIGSPLYIANSNGTLTETAPTTAGHFVRVVAYAISANEIYFNPDNTWIELT